MKNFLKALFIGGTGQISAATSKLAVEKGFELTLLNRGKRNDSVAEGANVVVADINDKQKMKEFLKDKHYDVVVDWIVFNQSQLERDIELFTGKTEQYILISSAAGYQKPLKSYWVDESTPLYNPYWEYAQDKIACEKRLTQEYIENGFPMTIVRPSHTYSEIWIPFVTNSNSRPWTIVDRLLKGKPIVVPGDGTSLWTLTHNTDFAKGFVGLMGNIQAIGYPFHITSDEVKTWEQYLDAIASAVGAKPVVRHLTSEMISAFAPDRYGPLFGDQCRSVVFDNSKIKRFVPGYAATLPFEKGIRMSIDYYMNHPERQEIDDEWNDTLDRMIAACDECILKAKK